MLLITALRRAGASFVVLLAAVAPASGQRAARHDADSRSAAARRPVLPRAPAGSVVVWPVPSPCSGVARCVTAAATPDDRPGVAPRGSGRGLYVLGGAVAGAALGWGWFRYQCRHGADCYTPLPGLLLAAGGAAAGALIGALIAPAADP
jgi:hypothetical protein